MYEPIRIFISTGSPDRKSGSSAGQSFPVYTAETDCGGDAPSFGHVFFSMGSKTG